MSDSCNCFDIEVEVIMDEPEIDGEIDVADIIFCSDGEDYKRGYDEGHAQGLIDGQADGYKKGYDEGHKVGSESGYSQGKQDGLTEGYDNGYTQGKADGYKDGYEEGYSKGYEQGLTDGAKEEQEKTILITKNGTTEITPDDNKVFSKVVVNTSVSDTFMARLKNELIDFHTDEVVSIPIHCFSGCSSLRKCSTPNATSCGMYAFYGCGSVEYIDFGKHKTNFSTNAIPGCHKLKHLIFRSDTLVPLPNVFSNVNSIKGGSCYFYVPKTLVEEYKNATNWSNYAEQIKAIEDYPEITGGIK